MIVWAIEACQSSDMFDMVVVSTDDQEIARIAEAAGALVPFIRPTELSDDLTPILPVMTHALSSLADTASDFGLACCVYPAASTLRPNDILGGAQLLIESTWADYCFGVVPFSHPIERALHLSPDSTVALADPGHGETRTQDLTNAWHDAGQFVWGRRSAWLAGRPILGNAVGYAMPSWRSVDIDTEDDWERAEVVHRLLRDSDLR